MEREHVAYFDYLRFFGAVGVVFLHVASQPVGDGVINKEWVLLTVITTFSYTAVPLFFMMSGYLLLTSEKTKNVSVLLKHRLPHLLAPLLFWTVVVTIWLMWKNNDASARYFINCVLSGISTPIMQHFWYIYTLSAIYILSPFLYRGITNLSETEHRYIFCVILIIFFQTMVMIVLPESIASVFTFKILVDLRFLGGHLLTFLLGYYLGKIRRRFSNIVLSALVVVDAGIIILGTYFASTAGGGYTGKFQDQSAGFSVFLAVCLFLLFKQNIRKTERKVNITPVINLSFGIYIMHNLLNRILSYLGFEAVGLFSVIGKTLLILFICYLVLKTLSTIKPLCFFATGITYDKACRSCNWIYTYNCLKWW